jgi:FixJ family two-component response regulator
LVNRATAIRNIFGKMNKEIALELGTSQITVKIQRRQAMRKMKAESVAELLGMAAKLGMGPGKPDHH